MPEGIPIHPFRLPQAFLQGWCRRAWTASAALRTGIGDLHIRESLVRLYVFIVLFQRPPPSLRWTFWERMYIPRKRYISSASFLCAVQIRGNLPTFCVGIHPLVYNWDSHSGRITQNPSSRCCFGFETQHAKMHLLFLKCTFCNCTFPPPPLPPSLDELDESQQPQTEIGMHGSDIDAHTVRSKTSFLFRLAKRSQNE